MANKDIKESQQSSQGIALGTQGNQAGSVPDGLKGPHDKQGGQQDTSIPNQDRSSATNQEREQNESSRH